MGSALYTPAVNYLKKIIEVSTTTPATTWNISSALNLVVGKHYMFVLRGTMSTTTAISFYVNNDTTATNYYTQRVTAVTSSIATARQNNAEIGQPATSFMTTGFLTIGSDGLLRIEAFTNYDTGVAVARYDAFITKTSAVASVTQIDLVGATNLFSNANFKLYEVF